MMLVGEEVQRCSGRSYSYGLHQHGKL